MSCKRCGGPAPTKMCSCSEKQAKRELGLSWALGDVPETADWLMEGFIPAHALTILSGREGLGKTTLAGLLISEVSVGSMAGVHQGNPQRVLVVGAEDGWRSRWIPRLMALGADLGNIARDPAWISVDEEGNDVVDLLAISEPGNLVELARLMQAHGISVLYLDHLSHVLRSGSNTDHYGTMTEALQRLNRWAEAHRISVIGGWHQSKGEGPVQDKLIGSVGIRTSARCVLVMAMDPDTGLRFVAVDKSNDLDRDATPAKSFTIVEVDVEHDGNTYPAKIPTGLDDVVDEGAGWQLVDRLANLAAMVDRPTTKEGDYASADAWLKDFFVERGPKVMRKVVMAFGEPEGFSERTIERAFVRLGGVSKTVGREAQWELGDIPPSPAGDDLLTDVDGRQPPSTSVNPRQPPPTSVNKSPSRRDGHMSVERDVPTADVIDLKQISRRLKEKK